MDWNWLDGIVKKSLTAGIMALSAYLAGGQPIEIKAIAIMLGYGIWTQVIVPTVNGWLGGQATGVSTRSNWELI